MSISYEKKTDMNRQGAGVNTQGWGECAGVGVNTQGWGEHTGVR